MLNKKVLIAALMSSLMMSTAAKAVDVFGYATFDVDQRVSADPLVNGRTTVPAQFDTQFFAIMIQHEHDVYKFFSELEFFHAPEMIIGTTPAVAVGTAPNPTTLEKGWGAGSSLKVERLYVDMNLSKMFNVRLGKSLPPLIWKGNHYPSIVKPITKPEVVVKGIAAGGYTGPQLFGQLGAGFNYNIWLNRNIYDNIQMAEGDTANGWNDTYDRFGRLGYKIESTDLNMEVSYISGFGENGTYTSNRTEYDLNLTYKNFSVWMESAARTQAVGVGDMTGSYMVLAYAMDFGGKEFSPFLMYDTFKKDTATANKATTAIGINYRPTGTTEHKVEYATIAKNGTTVLGEAWLKYQFIYFFN